jgi:hypothetical protein
MTTILLDEAPARNTADIDPVWMVLHTPAGAQRRRWGEDMARIVSDLVKHDWLVWTEQAGAEVHAKHRAFMAH